MPEELVALLRDIERRLSDLTGRVLMTTKVPMEHGEGSATLNLGDYSAGVYLIRVNDLVHRVMKQ